MFVFPEVENYFIPKHGDVACFKSSKFLHCTRRLQRGNRLGLAFFQKCSLYRQLRQLVHPSGPGRIVYKTKEGQTKIVETREGFVEKKKNYEKRVHYSTLFIKDFMEP